MGMRISAPLFAVKLSGTTEFSASVYMDWGVFLWAEASMIPPFPELYHERKVSLMKKAISLFLAMMLILMSSLALGEGTTYRVAIAQFAQHPSLDNCRTGFVEGLAEEGFVEGKNLIIDVQNAQADTGMAAQIAAAFAEGYDLVCPIATPMAMAAYNACEPKGIPVVYTAVSDPVTAQLAREDGTNPGQITGTSDQLPVDAQLKMIRALMPDAKKVGILYTSSESNSISALAIYESLAPNYGFEIVSQSVDTGADIPLALDALLPKVDLMTNLLDNTVVSYLPVVLEKAQEAGKPVFGSEIEQVKAGCAASEGLEYVELGRQTGRMAARVLRGESAQDIPFETITNASLYVNREVLAKLNLTLPAELEERAADVSAN